jgi:FkbM family methyltransferase
MKSLIKGIFKFSGLAISWCIQNQFLFKTYNSVFEGSSVWLVRLMVRYINLPPKDNQWIITLLNGKKVRTKIYAANLKTAQFALSYKWHSPSLNFTEKLLNSYYAKEIPWLDVGSNLGIRSLLALSEKRPVYFFEPNSELNRLNIERCRLNEFNNYSVFEIGVSDKTQLVEFKIDKTSYNSTLEADLLSENSIDHTETIKTDTLDNIYRNNFNTIKTACIKIDVEGHELNVIQGARSLISSLSPTMIIEVNKRDHHFQKFAQMIKEFGYTLFEIGDFGRRTYYREIDIWQPINDYDIVSNDFLTLKDSALINIIRKYSVNHK